MEWKVFCPNCDNELTEEYDIVDKVEYFSCEHCGLEYFKEFDENGNLLLEEI